MFFIIFSEADLIVLSKVLLLNFGGDGTSKYAVCCWGCSFLWISLNILICCCSGNSVDEKKIRENHLNHLIYFSVFSVHWKLATLSFHNLIHGTHRIRFLILSQLHKMIKNVIRRIHFMQKCQLFRNILIRNLKWK